MGREVGPELVQGTGVTGAAPLTSRGVKTVEHGRDDVTGTHQGQRTHPVPGLASEDPAPAARVVTPLSRTAMVDGRDRPAQARDERALGHRLTIAAGRQDRGLNRRDIRVGKLRRLRDHLQGAVQRQPSVTYRLPDETVPPRRGGEVETPRDLTGADPGRKGDLVRHDAVGRDVDRRGRDLLGLDGVEGGVRVDEVRLDLRLLDLERLDLTQEEVALDREVDLEMSLGVAVVER